MNRNNKKSMKTAKIWQRHTLAQACFLVAAGVSTSAWAVPPVDYTPGAALIAVDPNFSPLTQSYGQYWSTGYNQQNTLYQYGAGQVTGTLSSNTYFSSSLTGGGTLPVNIVNNSLLVYSYGNQNTVSNLSLGNLARVSSSNDGLLALNLQIFTALALYDEEAEVSNYYSPKAVLANVSGTGPYIEQAGKGSANLNLSGMTVAATLALNTVGTTLSGATPFGYSSTTKGASTVSLGQTNSAGDTNSSGTIGAAGHQELSVRGTTGSVNISNLQATFNAFGTANLSSSSAKITVSDTAATGSNPGILSDNISLNSNTIKASNTNNEAVNIVNASANSAAFTGSVSVTNIQSTKITDDSVQLANVVDGNVQVDLRNDNSGKTKLTGNLSVNDNTVVAQSMGNTAGSRSSSGGISAGNAIVFDGNANITGVTAPLALGAAGSAHLSTIDHSAGSSSVTSDLLINNVQRNTGNTFTATLDSSLITSKMDMLDGGTVNQNDNSQRATATGNFSGNLITAGASGSIANIVANATVVNSQVNTSTTLTASVADSAQSVSIGIASPPTTLNGNVNLNNNTTVATAEANVAASTLNLQASNLTVGGNGAPLVKLVPADAGTASTASAGSAATVLSAQRNLGLDLTSSNEGNSVGVSFNTQTGLSPKLAIEASQVNVNSNNVLSTATGNSASNALSLTASTAAGLNAGVGNAQYNGTSSSITANAGFATPLSVAIDALTVSASQLSMNSNTLSATAKGNSASNSLTATASTASGLSSSNSAGPFYANDAKPFSKASDVSDGANGATGVQSNADLALANAQADNGSTIGAVYSGSGKITTTTVGSSSILSANSNSQTASAAVNSASNTLSANIGNMSSMVMGLSSGQSGLNSVATASATAEASINTGAVSGASSLNLNQNTVSAAVSGNAGNSSLNLTSTTASGRDINKDPTDPTINIAGANINSGVASVASDFALSNNQSIDSSGNFTATVSSGTKVIAGAVTSSAVTVDRNNTLASATGNNATNAMVMAVTNLSQANTGLSSLQTLNNASFTAKVDAASATVGTGVVVGAASGAQIAVTGNLTQASALGNIATNSIGLSGTNVTGSAVNFDAPLTYTDVSGGELNSPASVALVSLQTSTGNALSASLGDTTTPKIGLTTGAVSNASTLSLTGNTLSSRVYNNSATNSVALTETNINSMSVGLASGQSINAVFIDPDWTPLTASTAGQIKITTGAVQDSSALTLTGNAIQSSVLGNSASNALSLTATNASGRNTSAAGHDQAHGTSHEASADFALVSEQRISNPSNLSSTSTGNIQVASGAVNASTVTASQNTLSAYTSANNVDNALNLAATNLTQATAGLASMQMLLDNTQVKATVDDALVKMGSGDVSASALSLTNNNLKATALANVATNQLNLTGTNATAGTVSLDASKAYAGSSTSVNAALALANKQESNGSTLVAASNGTSTPSTVQLNVGVVDSASSLTVAGNTVASLGYANNATNSMAVNVTNLNGITAGLANGQYAEAMSEKSTAVTNGTISALTGDVSGGSTVTVGGAAAAGNALSASSNVNFAANSLQLNGSQFTGRSVFDPYADTTPGSRAEVPADFSLANSQKMVANNNDFARATVSGLVKAEVGDVTSSAVNVNNNTVSAYTSGNTATNALGATAAGLTSASAAVASTQRVSRSFVNADTTAQAQLNASALNGANLSINGNNLKATVLGNLANNELNLTGTNATGAANLNSSNAFAETNAKVSATLALVNNQSSDFSQLAANNGTNTPSAIQMNVGLVDGASALTLAGNNLAALSYTNNTTNSMAVSVTNLNGMTAGVANGQYAEAWDEKSTAVTIGGIVISSSNVLGGSTLTVGGAAAAGNAVTASSNVNYAANSLLLTGSQITGRNAINPYAFGSAGDFSQVGADFSVANRQRMLGNESDFARASVGGGVGVLVGDVTSSTVNVSNNTVSAYVSGNNSSNGLGITASGLNTASAGVASTQLLDIANVKSDAAAEVGILSDNLSAAQVSLNSNNLKSTAVGNSVANTLAAAVSNASGINSTSVTPYANLGNADYPMSNVYADLMLNNTMAVVGATVQAKTGVLGGQSADVTQTFNNIGSSSQVNMNSNAVTSNAYANSANNAIAVRATDLTAMSTASSSTQSVSGSGVIANTNGLVKSDVLAIDNSNVSISSNQVSATSLGNIATNSLAVTASNVSGRGTNAYANTSDREQYADFNLINGQVQTGSSLAQAKTNGLIQIFTNGEDISGSRLSMNSNVVTSYASANQASNELTLAVTHMNAATAGLTSIQTLLDNSAADALTTGNVLVNSNGVSNATLSLNSNQAKATALGNLATNQLTMSGSSAQSNSGVVTPVTNQSTSADVSLTNKQYSNYGISATASTQASSASPTDPFEVQMSVAAVNSGAALTVNSNTVSSTSYLNSASNTLDLGVNHLTAMNAAVNNNQAARGNINANNNPFQSSATVIGKVSMDVSDTVNTADLAVNNNAISSAAYANSANNSLTVTGASVSGRGLSGRSTVASIARDGDGRLLDWGSTITADYALGNNQEVANGSAIATTTGNVNLNATAVGVSAGTLSLNTNNVLAYASGNVATNNLALDVTTLSNASAGVASTQTASSFQPSVIATVTGGVNLMAGDLDTSSNFTAKDNNIKATALGNVMGNALTISASTISTTGSGALLSEGRNGFARSYADFSIATEQEMMGSVNASATGKLGITTGQVTDSTLSLTGNSLKSLAQANSVSNDLSINAAQQNSVSASVVSYQGDSEGSGGVTATTSQTGAALSISTANLSNAAVTVSGNTILAVAGKNEVFNTLTVRGSNILGRNEAVADLVVGTPAATGVDYSLINHQTTRTNVAASVSIGDSGFVSSGIFSGGSVSLSDNNILASANANTVSNSLTLAAINRLEASGAINSMQELTSGVTISATVTGALSVETSSSAGNANVAVSSNVVKATASANLATNALNASATNGITAANAVTSPTTGTATPTFAVLNSQTNAFSNSVTASINSFTLGGAQLGGALNSGGTASVSGNLLQATAYGNSASNSVQLSALPATLNTASASITNVQYNLASVSATVNNATVQASGTSSNTSAGVNISGNSTIAMAVGNRATNVITGR